MKNRLLILVLVSVVLAGLLTAAEKAMNVKSFGLLTANCAMVLAIVALNEACRHKGKKKQ